MENVTDVVIAVIRGVVREQYPETEEVRGEQGLVEDLGLKSLDLARIVAKLDIELGVDPFSETVAITSIRTVGDLCEAYEQCFEADEGGEVAPPPAPEAEPEVQASPRSAALEAQKELRKRAR
jgi:acyl carrier protein